MVPLCSRISASLGAPPEASTFSGSSSSQIGSSAGKYRRFSSNRSYAESTQRSPNQVMGRTPCALSSAVRVSQACWKSTGRVSRHSSRPNRNGELAPSASCGPQIAWAAFHTEENRSGVTWRCSWSEVAAASATMVIDSSWRRSTPSMSRAMSSPRAARIWSLSRLYRWLWLIASSPVWACSRVGRMPTMTIRAPASAARRSA